MKNGNNDLRRLIPAVKRARDYHLYDFSGRRYLDLCLDGGRAVLGHKAGRIVRDMKNSLEKGLSASYPSMYRDRLLKQVKRLYPTVGSVSVVYAGAGDELPLVRSFDNETPADGVFELLLPMAGSGCLRVLCAEGGAESSLPAGADVPGFLLAGLCRAAADLAAFDETDAQKSWGAFDSPMWRRIGPWLYPQVNADAYPSLFKAALECGILLSPDYNIPSCAPSVFTPGEIKPIRELEGEFC